jgi:dihydrolipoamide dehydrogenase
MSDTTFDIIIVGGGPGGYVAALRAAQGGLKVALVERENIGGMCLNWGCIPSKSIQAGSDLLDKVKKASEYGLTGVDFKTIKPDWKAMLKRADDVVNRLTRGVKTLLDKNGVVTISGEAQVLSRTEVKVDKTSYTCSDLILATGSSYPIPDWVSAKKNLLNPKTVYHIDALPKKMVVIGAGVVGVEFAMLFSTLGVEVELVEQTTDLMPYMDKDLIQTLNLTLKKSRIKLHLGWKATELSSKGLTIAKETDTATLTADYFLLATRRKPNLDGLKTLLDEGMETDKNGYVRTDLRARTTLPHIYAVGDLNGRFMLAHVASAEGTCAVETILGKGRDLVYDMMPYNLYGKMEFASVGLTQNEAEKRGFLVATGKFPFAANGKALAEGNADGFVKVVYEKQLGEILGVHIAAPNATDLISESVMAMQVESTVWDVASSVHPHPTLSEAFLEATFKGMEQPLHTL